MFTKITVPTKRKYTIAANAKYLKTRGTTVKVVGAPPQLSWSSLDQLNSGCILSFDGDYTRRLVKRSI